MKHVVTLLLRQIEHWIVDRQDSTSCLAFVQVTLVTLTLIFGLQWLAVSHEASRALFHPAWLMPSLWAQALLIAWLSLMGALAWHRRHDSAPMPLLVQGTVVPGVLGVVLLSLAYGLKDTPIGIALLAEVFLARALFTLGTLRWAFLLGLLAVILAEVGQAMGVLAYAPMLSAPIYRGVELQPWWALWVRVVFMAAGLMFSAGLFLLATILTRHRKALETLVRTDMLTGLANRREFMTRLERESHRQARGGRPLSIVMLDVDHFKRVNDTFGHPAGDQVLAQVGAILRAHTRDQVDTAARYGGEEFVLLLPETDLSGAQHVAEKISARLRAHPFMADGQPFTVTQSVGIAQVVEGDTALALKVADRNLYQAKRDGRDQIVASVAFAQGAVHA